MKLNLNPISSRILIDSLEVLCGDQNFEFENEENRENYEIILKKIRRVIGSPSKKIDLSKELTVIVYDELEVRLEIERSNLSFFKRGGQFEGGELRIGKPSELPNQNHISHSEEIIFEVEKVISEIEKFFEISD